MNIRVISFELAVTLVATTLNAQTLAYITNRGDNTVSVVDTDTNTVIKTIPVGDEPVGVAVSPDERSVYVANFHSNTLSVINTTTNTVADTLPVGLSPFGIAIHPNGDRVYITNLLSNRVSVLDLNTSNITTITVQPRPSGIAMRPNGNQVYVTNEFTDLVTVIDTTTNTVADTVAVGADPYWIAINPDGQTAYVTSATTAGLTVIDLSDNHVVTTIPGAGSTGITVDPLGGRAYATNFTGFVSVIDTQTLKVINTIAVGAGSLGVDTDPSGNFVYVANQTSNNVSVVDTSLDSVIATIPVGQSPQALGEFVTLTFALSFPLPLDTPSTTTLSAVFDHHMSTGPNCPDDIATAYTGEEGRLEYGAVFVIDLRCGNLYEFQNESGTPFVINGNYTSGVYLSYDGHTGHDFPRSEFTPVLAVADGVVDPETGGPFNQVVIDHGNGYKTYYLHLSYAEVTVGQEVKRYQRIGGIGDTGVPGNFHLHFTVKKDTGGGVFERVDPYGWTGAGQDPYTLFTGIENVDLWAHEENPVVFTDGFESGNALAWSSTMP